MIHAVGLNSALDDIALSLVCGIVTFDDIVSKEDLHVDLRLLDSLQDKGGLVAVSSVETNARSQLRDEL